MFHYELHRAQGAELRRVAEGERLARQATRSRAGRRSGRGALGGRVSSQGGDGSVIRHRGATA
ncbi:hypothetical protein [Streptomyces sp. NPDC018031]|uniref:hypothetical protein n=1 Tax=Streptomyces sp. NPDC018031 TaxID=3365033 RepID=UPI00379D77BE